MAAAVERILAAIERKERIAIHGDYDCDGITSTVILRRALELFGATVVHFIPDRMKDGYGLQPETFDRLSADGVTAGDLGRLRHSRHRGGAPRARAAASISSSRITTNRTPSCQTPSPSSIRSATTASYPDKNLAGVGVALKLVQALCRKRDRERMLPAFVKVAAHRHTRRRRAAHRREPRHREARPRPAVAGAAQGGTCARCSRSPGLRASQSTAATSRS